MNRGMMLCMAAVIGAMPAAAPAQTAFDGTWKVDAASAKLPAKPYGWKIAAGTLTCVSCAKPYTVATDGAFHAVAGQPYWDETAVDIVDPMTVKQRWRKAGKLTEVSTSTVSADGTSYSWTDVDTSAPNGQPQQTAGTAIRVAKGAPGSHALAGMWRSGKLTSISADALSITLRTSGKTLMMTTPAGYHYTATIGGPAVPIEGDQAMTMAAVTMPSASTLVETDSRDGKPIGAMTMRMQPDGRTVNVTYDDKVRNTTASYVAMKQ